MKAPGQALIVWVSPRSCLTYYTKIYQILSSAVNKNEKNRKDVRERLAELIRRAIEKLMPHTRTRLTKPSVLFLL
jgi:hypothetical protein